MTVCVGVAVHDCLVFAADSAATLVETNPATKQSQIVNVYRHGVKVFNLYRRLPIFGMTCGMGNIGPASIGTLAKDLRFRFRQSEDAVWRIKPLDYTVEEIVKKARKFLFEECYAAVTPQPAAPHSLEFWVGGYGSDRRKGHEVWKIQIEDGKCPEPSAVVRNGETGLFVGGQPSPVNRLLLGFDETLYDALLKSGMAAAAAQSFLSELRKKSEVQLVAPTMPVQDAIDLADFLVEMTKQYFRFLPGADVVGGQTDLAVVTRYEGFKWIKRKHYYPSDLNVLETDHV